MRHIIYISKARNLFSASELYDLLVKAQKNNSDNGVTGCLLYDQGNYIQLLEGEDTTVGEIMGKIKNDNRHEKINILVD